MTDLTILNIPIAEIDVPGERARDYDHDDAIALAGIIATQGLMHPINVRRIGDRYRLISGLRRLRAFEINQRAAIPARISDADSDDQALLEEVMENLGRAELIALDRCHHLYELKQVWERLHPTFANGGGNQRSRSGGKSFPTDPEQPEIFGFASSVAEKVGLSKRTINIAVKIWSGLYPPLRKRLSGTALAHRQTELKALSELPINTQVKIVDLILGDAHPEIENVTAALAFLDGGIAPTAEEKRIRLIREGIQALPEPAFDRLVAETADRLIASLKRQGRI